MRSPLPLAWAILLPLLVLLPACEESASGPPVADSTMVDALVELHLLNARRQLMAAPEDTANAQQADTVPTPPGHIDVLRRHGIDSTAFARTIAYYGEHLEAYRRLYDRVIDRLQSREPTSAADSVRSRSTPGAGRPDR